MIEMKHINLSFKDKALFVDQEIKIDSGKITLITGESGSGKSTLLFELARLTDYADKEYIYENEKMSDLDEESFRRKIAFVFQDCRLFNDLSVIQNIEFFSQLGEVEFKKDKMMNLLDELDLNIDLNGEVKVLSGGQKQRLLILCCMMKDPKIIFLDEPTAYLDDVNRRRMRKIIYDLYYKYHKTVVIASHDLDMLEIADKHYHIESQQILLKKNIIKENKNLIARKTIQTFPLNYYLHAQKSNKVHYKRNIIISFLMIIMTYMMCFQAYYQKETERMINKAIDNELRISYKDGGNAYDMAGTPVSRTLVQDLSQNNMIQNISPFFEWNVAHMTVNDSSFKETVVIQPYYKKMKTFKRSNDPVFSIDKQKINTDKIYISYSLYQKIKGHIIYREYYKGSQEYCVKTLDATVIYNSNDEAEIILATASDITVNWHEQNSLKQQAQRDSLTHLYNLEAGKYIIDEYIKKNPKQQNALIVLDIDHFKEVNDTYGHLVGNELLIALAKYLLFHTNPNDIVIRMGGDEFVVFLKNVHDDLTYPCNQLMSHLNEISLSHHGIHFSISMGVYTFSNEQNFDNIFKIADDALYHSKRNGRNRYTIKYQK